MMFPDTLFEPQNDVSVDCFCASNEYCLFTTSHQWKVFSTESPAIFKYHNIALYKMEIFNKQIIMEFMCSPKC